VDARARPGRAAVSDPKWLSPFRVSFRMAPHYRQGRAFLAGDAVHIHSPAGGQGMNTCIQDAYNLAWKLALVQAGRAPESLLDSYEAERQPVARGVLEMTELDSRLVTWRAPIERALLARLALVLAQVEVIQQRFLTRLSELPINYRQSPIVAEHACNLLGRLGFTAGPRAGDRAPDAQSLQRPDGGTVRLFDLLRGTRHTLLLFAGREPQPAAWPRLAALAARVGERYGDQINTYLVVAGDAPPPDLAAGQSVVRDPQLNLHHRYGADGERLYLVRPDGYAGFRSQPADEASLFAYLGRMFVAPAAESAP
jgi:hypothetical protein